MRRFSIVSFVVALFVLPAVTQAVRADDDPRLSPDAPQMAESEYVGAECLQRGGFNTLTQAYITRFGKADHKSNQLGGFANATQPGVYFNCSDLATQGSVDFFVDAADHALVTMLTLMPTQKTDAVHMYSIVFDKGAPIQCARGRKTPCYRVLALEYY